MADMPNKPKPGARNASGLTKPGDLYLPGDPMPLPDVVEKDSDSVWALWSDALDDESRAGHPPEGGETDFKETVPMDFDAMGPTQIMDLPYAPEQEDQRKR